MWTKIKCGNVDCWQSANGSKKLIISDSEHQKLTDEWVKEENPYWENFYVSTAGFKTEPKDYE